ncbi:MAG: hypothetical protein RR320_03935, partial [Oscillospiraceae bacterium]
VTLPVRYSGKGDALAFTISYLADGENYTVKGVYNIPGVKEFVDEKEDGEEEIEPDPLTPYIIVESYSYGGASVTAGQDFQLKLRLRNTSETNSLQNIVMNIAPQGVFSVASASNTLYIDSLFAGSTSEQTVTINTGLTKVTDDKDANTINIKFDYQYLVTVNDKKVRKTGTSSETITLPVNFPDRFELSPPEMSSHNFIGQDCYFYVPMVNKGRSSVYNLTAMVKGETLSNPGQMQYIGNLTAGSSSGADFSLRFDTAGEHKGSVVVTYEDANMNPQEKVLEFTINVQDMNAGMNPGMSDPGMTDPGAQEPSEPVDTEPEKTDPRKIVVGVVALAVCAMSGYVTVQKAKAKRSIFIDEDL